MNASDKTICLCMIVKNEAPVIARCLKSVLPIIDHWIIVDTGSTDGTQDIVKRFLKDIPGELHERPWRDFAHNRSEALTLARPHADYSLIIDADDLLEFDKDFLIRSLTADFYDVCIVNGAVHYQRPQLISNRLPWRYEGVLHEFLTCEGAETKDTLSGVRLLCNQDGARRTSPDTYRRDARILEEALAGDITDFLRARYTFYLAQSYRDSGANEKALQNYLARAELGFWEQEKFVSLLHAGRLQATLDYPQDQVLATYRRATEICPIRAEALHGASHYCRLKNKFQQGYELARQAIDLVPPADGLFVEHWIYDYGVLDEFAVNAYWVAQFRDCLDASLKILERDKIPAHERGRVFANVRYALEGLIPPPASVAGQDDQAADRLPGPFDNDISFNICLVSINQHDRIFNNTVDILRSALNDLGYACSVRKNALKDGAINIVMGATVFAAQYEGLKYLNDQPYVLYQFEQLKADHGILRDHPKYLEVLRSAAFIFEYSPSGMEFLRQFGLDNKTAYLPPSFHKSLEVFSPGDNPDIDVLFFGSHNCRRGKIIDALRAHGLHTVYLFDVYGEDLIQFIRRSKIVINIHVSDGIDTLETVRISFLLANRCFVISETADHDPYGAGVVYADYEALVPACLDYLGHKAGQRETIADAGHAAFRRSDFVSDLRHALLRIPLGDMMVNERSEGSAVSTSKLNSYLKRDQNGSVLTGVPYLEFLKLAATHLEPRSYLEIGSQSGTSLRQFECDALCIDPAFQITQDALLGRKRTFFFQMTSDEFFFQHDPKALFPLGVDMGFLDGLHLFEALLRDFINFERCSNKDSIAILHDCLPTDLVMSSRQFQWSAWTGDVWKILPTLKRYRPDLHILLLDCPPTGLVACSRLDANSSILYDHFDEIIDQHSSLVLDEAGLLGLRSIFPLIDSRKLAGNVSDFRLLLASDTQSRRNLNCQ